jgi:hypothetical protein
MCDGNDYPTQDLATTLLADEEEQKPRIPRVPERVREKVAADATQVFLPKEKKRATLDQRAARSVIGAFRRIGTLAGRVRFLV